MAAEKWLPVPGFKNYEVSNHGRVRSLGWMLPRGETKTLVYKPGRVIKQQVKCTRSKPSALTVNLRKSGRLKTVRVHRLVLLAFVGKPPPSSEACHNDGNPFNNHVSNLRWDSHRNNVLDCIKHGTRHLPPIKRGEQHHKTVLNAAQVLEIRNAVQRRGVFSELGRKFGVSHQTIRRIRLRKTWSHV